MENKNNNRPHKGKTLMLNKGNGLKLDKPKAWSHQDDLTRGVGKEVIINTGADYITGKILAADQFSVKVRLQSPIDDGKEVDRIIFKSGIRYFEVR